VPIGVPTIRENLSRDAHGTGAAVDDRYVVKTNVSHTGVTGVSTVNERVVSVSSYVKTPKGRSSSIANFHHLGEGANITAVKDKTAVEYDRGRIRSRSNRRSYQ
jgi:acetate kinase